MAAAAAATAAAVEMAVVDRWRHLRWPSKNARRKLPQTLS
jgi:hypothetical protein